jgi:hypothetical protein
MGVLEVSRSIGDGQYKKLGVTCTPDVKKCSITDNDRYKTPCDHGLPLSICAKILTVSIFLLVYLLVYKNLF